MSGFLESLARYQDVMKQLQNQAKQLMMVGLTCDMSSAILTTL